MNSQHSDNVTSEMESSASSSGNVAAESPTMTEATSNNVYNSEYNSVLPTNAPVKRFIRKITHIDPTKLQQAGLGRKIAEAISKQKLHMATKKSPQTIVSSGNKSVSSTSTSVIKTIESTTPTSTRPCSSSTVIQSTLPPSPNASKPLSTKTIIPPKITITAPESLNETDRHHIEGLSPQQRLKQVKQLLNQKLLLKKISNQPGMSVYLKPPGPSATFSPLVPSAPLNPSSPLSPASALAPLTSTPASVPSSTKPKKLPTKLITMANTPPQAAKGFIHLIEPPGESPPKSPQDIARKLDFPTEVEKPNLIQYVRNNPMKFLTSNDNPSSPMQSKKLSGSFDDIPKASIKASHSNLNHKKKQLVQRRQKIDYPEVSPLKTPFPTVNLPQESPLPTIDTFKKPYPIPDSNYNRLQNETQSHSDANQMEFIIGNYENPPATQQIHDNDLNVTSSASPNCLIVLENKILSQDEMIDLTALRLSTSNTPQRFARPHKPIPEVVIKQEKLDDFPTTTSTIPQNTNALTSVEVQQPTEYLLNTIDDQNDQILPSKDSDIEMVHLPAKQNTKIIVNAQKLKLPQEKIAELAKQIAQSTATKTKVQKQNLRTNKEILLELQTQNPEMRLPISKNNTLTNNQKPVILNFQRNQVSFNSQPSTTTTEMNQNNINYSNKTTQHQNQFSMVKREPKTPQISPPKELTEDLLLNPKHGLQKVLIKSQETNTQFNSSFTGNRKSAVEILDESSDCEDYFSAVDFLAAFADTNPITEETTLELSPEELNLSASCAMSLPPLRIASNLPRKRSVSTPQRQLSIPTTPSSNSSQYMSNDSSAEVGKSVAVQNVDKSQAMRTIVIQSSNGPETIVRKATENKCPLVTIPSYKMKSVKLLNVVDSKKMALEKLSVEPNKPLVRTQDSTTFNKVKSDELENVVAKESDILGESREHEDQKEESNKTPVKLPKKIINFEFVVKTTSEKSSDKHIGTKYSKEEEEYVKPTESRAQADDYTQSNVSAKVQIKSTEKSETTKSILKPALPTEIDKQNYMPSFDITTQTNLSNNTPEKSTEMTVKSAIKPVEKSIQTPIKSIDKMPMEIDNKVVLEPSKSKDANPTETVDTNTTTKDVGQNNLPAKTSLKSPEKSINLKSILKLTVTSDAPQQNRIETSDTKESKDTPVIDNCETTKQDEFKSMQDTGLSKINESNSNNTVPSKRISRFKKGKINLVIRNKSGAVTNKKETATSGEIKVGNDDNAAKEDVVERDGALSETTSNIKKNEWATAEIISGNEHKAYKEDEAENSSTRNTECVTTTKTMAEKTISEENNISECTVNIEDQIMKTYKDQVQNKAIDEPESQTKDIQSQEDKLNESSKSISDTKTPTVSKQIETVTFNDENNAADLNTSEAGRGERDVEPKKGITESKEFDLNTNKAATSYNDTDKLVGETPSESVELCYTNVQRKEELLQTSKTFENASKDNSQLLKPPKMPKRKSEAQNSEGSVQVLEELKQPNVSLVNIVKHSSIDICPNLPKIPFKKKCRQTIENLQEEEVPKGIKSLLKIKKSVEIDNKNIENVKEKPPNKGNETNLLKSKDIIESTSSQIKKCKTNENVCESNLSSEEPVTSGKETKRKVGRPSLQYADKSTVKANENSKNKEHTRNSDECTPLLSRRSLRFSLNSKPETATATPPPKTRHSSRHQISDDDLEFLPVNAEIKEFRVTKTRNSLNDKRITKEKINESSPQNLQRKLLSSKSMKTNDSIEIVIAKPHVPEKKTKLTATVTVTNRTRISSQPSETEDTNRDDPAKLQASYLTKITRFTSQSSENKTKQKNDASCHQILISKPSATIKRTRLASNPTDPEDSCQESPHNIMLSHTKQRKKLRKTLEDIKKFSQKPHPDTDSDEDYREFDSINGLEDENEFLGFDENSVGSSKVQKKNDHENAENKSKITPTTKATKGGTLKNWLTTGKGISPTFNKDQQLNRRHDDIIARGIPLKKRWDMVANLNEETDITDDTSPADDEDDRDPVRGLKTVIDSNTDLLESKKTSFNKTKDKNPTFLEPRPVATKSNAGTDSDCSQLSTQMPSKRSLSLNKLKNRAQVLETHKSLDIPATETLITPDNSIKIYASTSNADNSKTKAQNENSKVSTLKVRSTEDLSVVSNKHNKMMTVKLTDKKVSFEEIHNFVTTPVQLDLSTKEEFNKIHDSLTKSRRSKSTSKIQENNKVSIEKTQAIAPAFQSDLSTEDESNRTQESSTKSSRSKAKSKKLENSRISLEKTPDISLPDQSDFTTAGDSNQDWSSRSRIKKKTHNTKKSSEDALDIAKTHDAFSQLKTSTISEKSKKLSMEHKVQIKKISTVEKKNEEFQRQETPSKSKKTKTAKEIDEVYKDTSSNKTSSEHKIEIKESLIKENNTDESHRTQKTSFKHSSTNSSKKKNDATASDLSDNLVELDSNSDNIILNSKKSKTSKEKCKLSDESAESTVSTTKTFMIKEKKTLSASTSTLSSPPKAKRLYKRPLRIEDAKEECSPQIPKKRGPKRKILKIEDSSEDDSKSLKQNTKSLKILSSLQPITTPHLAATKNDSSVETSTPSKKRKTSNIDTTTVSFNPRLLLITKRDQIDTDEILTEPNPGTGPIQCGLCLRRTTSTKWTLHLAEHYGVGWQVGKPKLDVENRTTVFTNITSYFKTTEIKGLSCRMCKKLYRSALGLITHIESCGAPVLRLPCEYCNKDYTKSTMPIHQRSCSERTKLEKSLSEKVMALDEPHEEVFSNTGRLKRHSTIKAESKLKVIGAELEENTEQPVEFQPKDHIKYVPPLDSAEVHTKWYQDLEKFGKGFCPKKICKFNSPHVEELEKHIQQCKLIKTGYFCNFCRRACFDTEEVALDHIFKKHTPGKEKSDDSDCNLKSEAEQSSDDDNDLSEGVNEDETENEGADEEDLDDEKDYAQPRRVKKKVISNRGQNPEAVSCANRKKVYETRSRDLNREVFGKWKNFTSLNYSSEALFPQFTSSYSVTKNQDFAKYLPSQESSMKFSLKKECKLNTTVGEPNPNIQWKELKRFETMESKSEIFYFLGAPVKFCTWIPLPPDAAEQYILVGYRKEMFSFVKFNQPKSHHTVLMIFKVIQQKNLPKLELHYGFIINDGPVHGVQFLPSGGYNKNTNRLGLVAVATVNSPIKVYSLPIEVEIQECDKIENVALINITASFELNVDVMDQGHSNHSLMKPQCLEICWSEYSGHNHIFASYSNGFIGIWDITDDSQENLNRFVVENVICYAVLNYFYIGEKGSNCFAVHYDTNGPRWLAISAKYRKFVVYDIHNLMQPIIIKEECNKNVLRCLNWSPVWGPILAGFCDSIPNNGRCIYSISATNIMFSQQRFENMVSAVSYIHYSPVTNLLVSTADNGDILFADPRELHFDYGLGKKFGAPRRILSSMDVKQLDHKAIVRPPLKQSKTDIKLPCDWSVHELNYKEKYGLVFNPPFKLKEEHKTKYYNSNRRAPLNITPLMRINTLKCNLNFNAKRLVAAGYENGFMRIIYFNKDIQFSNYK